MGLDITFTTDGRKLHGNCGVALQSVVHFCLPESPTDIPEGIQIPPETDSHYILNEPHLLRSFRIEGLPENEEGFAILCAAYKKALSEEEIAQRLRTALTKMYAESSLTPEAKEELILNHIENFLSRYRRKSLEQSIQPSLLSDESVTEVEVYKFIRWINQDEFDAKAQETTLREAEATPEHGKEDSAYTLDRWYFGLSSEAQAEACRGCALNISATDNQKFPLSAAIDSYLRKDDSRDATPCNKGGSYSYWTTFLGFLAHENVPTTVLSRFYQSEGEVAVYELTRLEKELEESRHILETTMVPGMTTYNHTGEVISLHVYDVGALSGDKIHGYGVGLESLDGYISVVFQGSNVFTAEKSLLVKTWTEEGLDGVMSLNQEISKSDPRYHFVEITRDTIGDTFWGKTPEGVFVGLPPVHVDGKKLTPFSPFCDPFNQLDEETIAKVVYTPVRALESFEYLQSLLERFVTIAIKNQIPLRLH